MTSYIFYGGKQVPCGGNRRFSAKESWKYLLKLVVDVQWVVVVCQPIYQRRGRLAQSEHTGRVDVGVLCNLASK